MAGGLVLFLGVPRLRLAEEKRLGGKEREYRVHQEIPSRRAAANRQTTKKTTTRIPVTMRC
jgi:hypothetical protein